MKQEVGETSKAIVEADEKQLEKILHANKDRQDPYYIVIFAKPAKVKVEGRAALIKVMKPYNKKPASQVGMIVGKVDNQSGKITWEVNMPDRPFGYELLGLESHGVTSYETKIPNAYIYN